MHRYGYTEETAFILVLQAKTQCHAVFSGESNSWSWTFSHTSMQNLLSTYHPALAVENNTICYFEIIVVTVYFLGKYR